MNTVLRKMFAWGSMLGAFAVIYFFTFPHYRQGEASVAGRKAEDFAFNLDGKPSHLSDLRGKVVVLNFWGSWCPPCVEETPALIALQQRIGPRNGVVLGIAADTDEATYEKFLREHGVNFPTARDPGTDEDHHSPIAQIYGTSMYPETYIIDRKGVIIRKIIGPQDWNSAELLSYFDAILGQS
jgi:cytochrome c biogenesis protein CcmG, thiol:disulfide interchange protein DsbE